MNAKFFLLQFTIGADHTETCEIVIHNEGVIERKATDENEVEIVDKMIGTEENEDEAKNVLEVLGIFESVLIQSENAKNDIMNSKSEYNRCAIPRLTSKLGNRLFDEEEKKEKKYEEMMEDKIRRLRKKMNVEKRKNEQDGEDLNNKFEEPAMKKLRTQYNGKNLAGDDDAKVRKVFRGQTENKTHQIDDVVGGAEDNEKREENSRN